jgi:hypothetical protein
VPLGEGVVDAAVVGWRQPRLPPLGGEHPFVQPFAGMAERCVAGLTLSAPEAVE